MCRSKRWSTVHALSMSMDRWCARRARLVSALATNKLLTEIKGAAHDVTRATADPVLCRTRPPLGQCAAPDARARARWAPRRGLPRTRDVRELYQRRLQRRLCDLPARR